MKWDEFVDKDKYSQGGPEERRAIKNEYFNKYVAPKYADEDMPEVINQFKGMVNDWETTKLSSTKNQVAPEYLQAQSSINDTPDTEAEKVRIANDLETKRQADEAFVSKEKSKQEAVDTGYQQFVNSRDNGAFQAGLLDTPIPNLARGMARMEDAPYEPKDTVDAIKYGAGKMVGLIGHAPMLLGPGVGVVAGAVGSGFLTAADRMASLYRNTIREKGKIEEADVQKAVRHEAVRGLAEGTLFGLLPGAGKAVGSAAEKQLLKTGLEYAPKIIAGKIATGVNAGVIPAGVGAQLAISSALDGPLDEKGIASTIVLSLFPHIAQGSGRFMTKYGGKGLKKIEGKLAERDNIKVLSEALGETPERVTELLNEPSTQMEVYEILKIKKDNGELPEKFLTPKREEMPAYKKVPDELKKVDQTPEMTLDRIMEEEQKIQGFENTNADPVVKVFEPYEGKPPSTKKRSNDPITAQYADDVLAEMETRFNSRDIEKAVMGEDTTILNDVMNILKPNKIRKGGPEYAKDYVWDALNHKYRPDLVEKWNIYNMKEAEGNIPIEVNVNNVGADNYAKILKSEEFYKRPVNEQLAVIEEMINYNPETGETVKPKTNFDNYLEAVKESLKVNPDLIKSRGWLKEVTDTYIKSWGKAVSDASKGAREMVELNTLLEANRDRAVGHRTNILDEAFNDKSISKADRELIFYMKNSDPTTWTNPTKKFWYDKYSKLSPEKQKYLKQKVQRLDDVFGEKEGGIAREAIDSGMSTSDKDGNLIPWESRKDYAPNELDPKKAKADPKKLLFQLERDGKIEGVWDYAKNYTNEQAYKVIQQLEATDVLAKGLSDGIATEKITSMQKRRQMEWPEEFLRSDPAVFYENAEKQSRRVEQAKLFGPKDELIYRKLAEAGAEIVLTHDKDSRAQIYQKTEALADRIMGKQRYDSTADKVSRFWTGFQALTKMTTSVFSQFAQMGMGIVRGDTLSWAKALKEVATNNKEASHFAKEVGSTISNVQHQFFNEAFSVQSGSAQAKLLKYNGFRWADTLSRKIAAITGKFYADKVAMNINSDLNKMMKKKDPVEIARMIANGEMTGSLKANIDRLKRLEVDPMEMIADKLTGLKDFKLDEKQSMIAARKFEVDTNFRANFADLPEFAASPMGKIVTQFKTVAYLQTKFIRDNVYREIKENRNFMPLMRLAAVSLGGGMINDELRTLFTGGFKSVGNDRKWLEDSGFRKLFNPSSDDLKNETETDKLLQKITGSRQGAVLLNNIINYVSVSNAIGIAALPFEAKKYGKLPLGPTGDMLQDFLKAGVESAQKGSHKARPYASWAVKNFVPGGSIANTNMKAQWKESDAVQKDADMTPQQRINKMRREMIPKEFKEFKKQYRNMGKPEKTNWNKYGI